MNMSEGSSLEEKRSTFIKTPLQALAWFILPHTTPGLKTPYCATAFSLTPTTIPFYAIPWKDDFPLINAINRGHEAKEMLLKRLSLLWSTS